MPVSPGLITLKSQRVQARVEGLTSAGTPVPGTRQLVGIKFTPTFDIGSSKFTPSGSYVPTIFSINKDESSGSFSTESDGGSAPNYDEMTWMFASVMSGVVNGNITTALTPTVVNNTQQWRFQFDPHNPNPGRTYTIEIGNDLRGQRVSNVNVQSLSLQLSREKFSMSGNTIGGQLRDTQDGLNTGVHDWTGMTAGPTMFPAVAAAPGSFCLYLSEESRDDLYTTAGDPLSPSKHSNRLMMVASTQLNVGERRSPYRAIRCDIAGYPVAIEDFKGDWKFKGEASDDLMVLMRNIRSVGTKRNKVWMRLESIGPIITGSTAPYRLIIVDSTRGCSICSPISARMICIKAGR